MRRPNPLLLALVLALVLLPGAPLRAAGSEPRAVEIANRVLERLGGKAAWDGTRYVRWNFFGKRMHYWDRQTGDIRIETPEGLILMNLNTKQGRVFEKGSEILDPQKLAEGLKQGDQIWVNDSYWMFMPYKLLDPGVTLKYAGERKLEDGRLADVLDMTFEAVGYTPENRYEVFVARDSGLVEQWAFYEKASDTKPGFTLPWSGWRKFGKIELATGHGRDADWQIAVFDALPESVFHSPAKVEL